MCETPEVAPKKLSHGASSATLRDLARHLNLSPSTISLVVNASPGSAAIPKGTQERVFNAARELNYRPNFLARSLRSRRTYSIGVMVPEVGEGYSSLVLSGIEECLLDKGYVYLVTSHRHRGDLLERGPRLLYERCVEGLIAVDTPLRHDHPLPVVAVSGHEQRPGLTNIVLNHRRAAELGLRHLQELGHRRIAFFLGQTFSSDSQIRWDAIQEAARVMSIAIDPSLVIRLEGDSPSPEAGYRAAHVLLASGAQFSALWAFNDISAMGAMRAFVESGKRVPRDISVLGFDDVHSAAFQNPSLSTVKQPLCAWALSRRRRCCAAFRIVRTPGIWQSRVSNLN